ncbi:MAG TPA: AAA family ATPase [Thermoanaerobaculia bacterium]|nr:AAA family ATPase [Thermoanaerobaculia bacterium]
MSSPTPSTASSSVELDPKRLFAELRRGVLGQDRALRFVAVAVHKHVLGELAGNILLIGSSGTGKTTIMNNLQRLYDTTPGLERFRAVTILNANLLVDSERTEFRGDRLLAAVEQRARTVVGEKPGFVELVRAMGRATVCVDEIDKMATLVAGRPNPVGVVLQQGLLTLMEGEKLSYRLRAWEGGEERERAVEIDTRGMMFVCGGAFEGLYDQVYFRVTKSGSGERIKTEAIKGADGSVRLEMRFTLAEFLKMKDLFDYGMVPQFLARFDKVIVLNDLDRAVLEEILMTAIDSPYSRSRRYFAALGIELELEPLAAAMVAERAALENRTGARALRDVFAEIVNPLEFEPDDDATPGEAGRRVIRIDAARVKRALS